MFNPNVSKDHASNYYKVVYYHPYDGGQWRPIFDTYKTAKEARSKASELMHMGYHALYDTVYFWSVVGLPEGEPRNKIGGCQCNACS